jgi:hypothetical protein
MVSDGVDRQGEIAAIVQQLVQEIATKPSGEESRGVAAAQARPLECAG